MPQRKSIQDAINIAIQKDGKCLSSEYINSRTPLIWSCNKCNYIWEATYTSIKNNNTWCAKCNGTAKKTQKEIEIEIKARGGKCLSEYKNSWTKLNLICKFEHEFSMSWNKIKAGQWCPICNKGLSERICKLYFETLFKKEFITIRPDWLMGDKGRSLELDGYCKELNIAFEHNGTQHDRKSSRVTQEEFERTQINDRCKKDICDQIGIKLIIIPALFVKIKISELKNFIKKECIRLNIETPADFDDISVNVNKAYHEMNVINENQYFRPSNAKYSLKDMQEIAKKHEGECLSPYYDCHEIQFKCKNNHIWTASPGHIMKDGNWCMECHIEEKLRKGHILTEEVLRKEYENFPGFQRIADKYGVAYSTVVKYCRKYGLAKPATPRQ